MKENCKYLITTALFMLFVVSCSAPSTPAPANTPAAPPANTQAPPPANTQAPPPANTQAPTTAPQPPAATPTAAAAAKGGDLVWGFSVALSGVDPHVNTASSLSTFAVEVYDFLTYVTPDFKVNPSLATTWQVSPDGKVYTFTLKKGVKFHDGTDLDADAVKFNFDRILDPKTASQTKARLGPLESVTVKDPSTIEMRLTAPYALFLNALSDLPAAIASPTAIKKWGADYSNHQVGSGPFKFVEYVPNDHLKVAANPDYNWASPAFGRQGPPLLDTITFRMLADPATRVAALQSGEVQGVEEVLETYVAQLKSNAKFQLMLTNPPGMPQHWALNTSLPPTDDLLVRQAIEFATNKQGIIDTVFQGIPQPAFGPLMANVYGHSDKVKTMYTFNVQKAKDLLDQAGWKADASGARAKNGTPLTLKMATWPFNSSPQVAQVIQSQLAAVGIKVDIEMTTFPATVQKGTDGTANMIASGATRLDGSILSDYYHSKNAATGFNWAKFKNADLDKLLDAAPLAPDRAAQAAIYQQAEEVIMANALLLPIQDYTVVSGMSSKLKGVIFRPDGREASFYNATLDK